MQFPFEPPNNRKFDVVGFGTNAVDYLIQVPEYPAFDSKLELNDYVQAAGGEAATTMVGLQRLGLKTSYVGRFGNDGAGDFGLKSLDDEGVDTSRSQRVDGARTQIAFIIVDENTGERTVIWKRDKKLQFTENDVSDEISESARVLHLTPHDTRAGIKLARKAREIGTIVSIDIDTIFEGVEDLLPLVDILISSAGFAESFTGIRDQRAALDRLKFKYGCKVIGVTLGQRGSLIHCANEFFETEGFAVPNGCKDTTGAGDSFRSGFLYGFLSGESIEESARMANAVAALKCREIGARTALPDIRELNNLLRS
ncbi:MAG: carbohydrate kinase family protein [Pyrinomonadaceae bacterium]|nr:carbohydrate kinase family protein [Pyrinomonadaceae bacterium]